MNEKISKFFISLSILLLCSNALTGTLWYLSARRADIKIDTLAEELGAERTRHQEYVDTVRDIRTELDSIGEELGTDTEELGDIIYKLQLVRDTMQNMASRFNSLGDESLYYSDNSIKEQINEITFCNTEDL